MAPIDSRELNLTDVSETDVTPLVPKEELNAWKRGFTPQAEIWNGRFAMLGVTLVLATVLILNWGWLGF
ncbi:high light inducible protein [Synechococcus elongatus]|uniref:High light inducible protein n=2 Tax=Synechococcus elongatus TaxID=32046 RepID=A0AAN1QQI9_SYNEL|nr:high light inducible protein [Synechococcus elongatus]